MPQLSLYITDENLALLRSRAAEEGVSPSKHVGRLIQQDAQSGGWPSEFWELYGAIDDDSFCEPSDAAPADDIQFEAMFA